ncbi:hypothetical protein [Brachybacterium sp.]|uniref:hypothetical protein n=1 Tax=Brachybacterium sp. TaxID=1891286 RepID=UPI002ED26551
MSSITRPRRGHGDACQMLYGTLIEMKSLRGTQPNADLASDVIHQLLGYVLSVPPGLEKEQPVTQAGWYLARYGVLRDLPIESTPRLVYGKPLSLANAREAFRHGVAPDEVSWARP